MAYDENYGYAETPTFDIGEWISQNTKGLGDLGSNLGAQVQQFVRPVEQPPVDTYSSNFSSPIDATSSPAPGGFSLSQMFPNFSPSSNSAETGGGFWSGLGSKIEAGADWMDKHKTATSAGVSALAFFSSLPASKRAAAMQKMMFEQDQARQAAAQAQHTKNNAPFTGATINRGTPALAPGMGTTNYSRSNDPRYRNADIYAGLNKMNFKA